MYKYKRRFTDFDLLMYEKELQVKRKREWLKLTNEKQKCRLRN